jgi:hypothetical protein
MNEFEQKVQQRAYELWEQAGRPENCADEFWFLALRAIVEERSSRERAM